MKRIITTWNAILLFSISVCYSCNGQNADHSPESTFKGQKITNAVHDTVTTLDGRTWYVFQDRNSNYWFGTNGQGVYQYNGKSLIQFARKDGLCNDQVRGIQEDGSGNIYVNTVSGVSKFDGHTFKPLIITNSNWLPDGGWRLHPGDLWFQGAQDSGVVYRYDGSTLHRLQFPKTKAGEDFIAEYPRSKFPQMTFSPYDVYSIYKDSKGNLWFGTNLGVCRYDGKTFDWISEKELGIDAIAYHVRSTFEDKNGDFWFSNTMHRFNVYPNGRATAENGFVTFSSEKGIVDSKEHDAAYFLSSVEDNNGDIWMVTYDKGVWRYDGKKMTQYLVKEGTENVTLFTIYKDKQGTLWLGTHTAGAYKFNGLAFEKFNF